MPNPNDKIVPLSPEAKLELACAKATCPFIGGAIVTGRLAVRNELQHPLASIDDVRHLGNEGGGDLGELLAMFASGNHALMRNDAGELVSPVPEGLFSLDFPGSQGAHPGDSGILLGNPPRRGPYMFSEENFARLAQRAEAGRLTRAAVGDFIAENVARDPDARKISQDVVVRMGHDLFALFEAAIPAAIKHVVGLPDEARAAHLATQRLTKLLAEDHVAGSSGEFGLLFTLLTGDAAHDDEPVLLVDELRMMFQMKRLPPRPEQQRKTRIDWAKHTFAILFSAYTSLGKRKLVAKPESGN